MYIYEQIEIITQFDLVYDSDSGTLSFSGFYMYEPLSSSFYKLAKFIDQIE